MKQNLILVFVLGLFGLFACSDKDNLLIFKLDTPFVLGYHERATLEENPAVTIQFDKVVADSRCPVDAECVWAGRVEIELTFTNSGSSQTKILILGDPKGTSYTDTANFGDFTVKLLQVKPLPRAAVVTPHSAYTVELQVHQEP